MGRVVALGDPLELLLWPLAGAELIEAAEPEEVRRAWSGLGPDVGLVVLTRKAREALPARLETALPWAVLPE